MSSKEWYLLEYEQKTYLRNKTLQFKHVPCDSKNHFHCELCWARFSIYSGDLQEGYYEECSKSWICEECYTSFKALFGWSLDKDRYELNVGG